MARASVVPVARGCVCNVFRVPVVFGFLPVVSRSFASRLPCVTLGCVYHPSPLVCCRSVPTSPLLCSLVLCTCLHFSVTRHPREVFSPAFHSAPRTLGGIDPRAGLGVDHVVYRERQPLLYSGLADHGRSGRKRVPDCQQGIRRAARPAGACGHGHGDVG